MPPNVENPMTDPAKVDEFYNDDGPPIRGHVTVWVKVPVAVPVDEESIFEEHGIVIECEEQAILYATSLAEEYLSHAIERHIDFLKPGSPLADLDPDSSGIEIDSDNTEFFAH